MDGTPADTYRWAPGEPSGRHERCGSILNGFFYDRECSDVLPALCGASPSCAVEQSVMVSLPPGAGAVSPPIGASVGTAVVNYRPPVPTVSPASGNTTASNQLAFTVSFSVPVTGVTATDFVVSATGATVISRAISGSGTAYELSLVMQALVDRPCPTGFTASPALPTQPRYCARVVAPGSVWADMQYACAPYSLTAIKSAAHNAFVRQLANESGVSEVWCVRVGAPCPCFHLESDRADGRCASLTRACRCGCISGSAWLTLALRRELLRGPMVRRWGLPHTSIGAVLRQTRPLKHAVTWLQTGRGTTGCALAPALECAAAHRLLGLEFPLLYPQTQGPSSL